ncbi:hypothetical protein CA54_12130 [Symmachiella macrocystis]|uniref:Uncharacterized protein n=1 Tax=Symmachiella macrocystis TaxID=2527985 RepID=A0A5C6BMR1_9PLAN|nr:hypothetical protein [Symmachiella macrocystis]TWU12389.1 hypothetical protein CA54_12130 [Symmachiella macrocystis]
MARREYGIPLEKLKITLASILRFARDFAAVNGNLVDSPVYLLTAPHITLACFQPISKPDYA